MGISGVLISLSPPHYNGCSDLPPWRPSGEASRAASLLRPGEPLMARGMRNPGRPLPTG